MSSEIVIGVVAADLSLLINAAGRANQDTRHRSVDVREWTELTDAVHGLTAFRAQVAVALGVSSLEPDERLLDALREVIAVKRREWQCEVCQEWVAGAHLMCPRCTGDVVPTGAATTTHPDTGAEAERTGRFEPVPPPPLDPGRDLEHWDNHTGPEPAHALDDTPMTPDALSDLLTLVGVTVPAEHIRDHWTNDQRHRAEVWAGAVYLDANDNAGVVIPPQPEFLDHVTAPNKVADHG